MTSDLDRAAERAEISKYAALGRDFLEGKRSLGGERKPVPETDPAVEALRENVREASLRAFQQRRQVLTVHPRYGQPPGELAYKSHTDWTPAEQQIAADWLRNHQAADWWRSQGAAQRAAS